MYSLESLRNEPITFRNVLKAFGSRTFIECLALSALVTLAISFIWFAPKYFFIFVIGVTTISLLLMIFSTLVIALTGVTTFNIFFLTFGLGCAFKAILLVLSLGSVLRLLEWKDPTNKWLQFFLANLWLEIIALFVGISLAGKNFKLLPSLLTVFSVGLALTVGLALLIILGQFPTCARGLHDTTFLQVNEFAIAFLFIVFGILLVIQRKHFTLDVFSILLVAVFLRLAIFTLHSNSLKVYFHFVWCYRLGLRIMGHQRQRYLGFYPIPLLLRVCFFCCYQKSSINFEHEVEISATTTGISKSHTPLDHATSSRCETTCLSSLTIFVSNDCVNWRKWSDRRGEW